MTLKLPKIAKPRPVKWASAKVLLTTDGFYYVQAFGSHSAFVIGPYYKTKAGAIRAWNKQEGKP